MLVADEKRLRWMGLDMRPRWRRRMAVVVVLLAYLSVMFWAVELKRNHAAFFVMMAAQVWISVFSIFQDGRLVKNFDVKKKAGRGPVVILSSLDDWARYRFDTESFDACTEAQQKELLARYRVGNWMLPKREGAGHGEPDEREAAERDAAIRRAGYWMMGLIGALAGQFMWRPKVVDGREVGMWLLLIATGLSVGPKVIVLWEEPDPREGGEMKLVGSQV